MAMLMILIGIAFVALCIGFFVVITRNMRQGRVFRRKVAQHIETLRIGKMLRALGIDTSSYLHDVPVHQVNADVKQCNTCDSMEVCDERLSDNKLDPEDIDFCPNQQHLAEFKQAQNANRVG